MSDQEPAQLCGIGEGAVDYYARGCDTLEAFGWAHMAELSPGTARPDAEFWELTSRTVFGQMVARPGLTLRERELIIMAIIMTQGSTTGVKPHFRNCHKLGVTEREVREVIYAVCFYGGWPKGSQSVAAFQEVLAEPTSTWPQSHLIEPPLPLVED